MNEFHSDVELRWGVKIPLRDGIHVQATVYLPKSQSEPAPCVLALTPYIADSHHERGIYFAQHGLPFVIIDVRGRGNSEGIFRPYIQEAQDGHDSVEWLACQPYCNGKVAMWGGSYLAYGQWATAKEFPAHLATIVPAAAPCIGVDFPMRNNIFSPFLVRWIALTAGHASQTRIFSDDAFWSMLYREWHESGRRFSALADMVGAPCSIFHDWLSHPEPDAYWDAYNPTDSQYARMRLPVLTITGSYDDDQPGALEHYRRHMRNACPSVRAQHFLIIGPWNHAGTVTPKAECGRIEVGAASVIDMGKLHLDWYGWTMQNGPRPEFLQKPVSYYVMGLDQWRYADTLDQATARYQAYYLDSSNNANDVFSAGSLGSERGTGQADYYTYDPADSRGPEVQAEAESSGDSLVDQRLIHALRGRQLVYHSSPFMRDTEITGFFKFSAWISIDCPDTDLYASVYEIAPDGSSVRLSTDAIRARYREGLRTSRLIQTSEPLSYDFARFTFVSRQIKIGHRLRLVIAPMGRLIESTFAQKNYNSGGVVADESAINARPVTVRLFHDELRPSALYVPVGQS